MGDKHLRDTPLFLPRLREDKYVNHFIKEFFEKNISHFIRIQYQ